MTLKNSVARIGRPEMRDVEMNVGKKIPAFLPRRFFKPPRLLRRPFLPDHDIDVLIQMSAQLPREIVRQADGVPKNVADIICFACHDVVALPEGLPGGDRDERQQNRVHDADDGDGEADDIVVRPAKPDGNKALDNREANAREENEQADDYAAHDPGRVIVNPVCEHGAPISNFPAICSSSGGAKTFCLDKTPLMAEFQQGQRDRFNETGRPADENFRIKLRPESEICEHVTVDPSRAAAPARGLRPRERVHDLELPVARGELIEFFAIDDVLESSR